jgi:hypothetical protein
MAIGTLTGVGEEGWGVGVVAWRRRKRPTSLMSSPPLEEEGREGGAWYQVRALLQRRDLCYYRLEKVLLALLVTYFN